MDRCWSNAASREKPTGIYSWPTIVSKRMVASHTSATHGQQKGMKGYLKNGPLYILTDYSEDRGKPPKRLRPSCVSLRHRDMKCSRKTASPNSETTVRLQKCKTRTEMFGLCFCYFNIFLNIFKFQKIFFCVYF